MTTAARGARGSPTLKPTAPAADSVPIEPERILVQGKKGKHPAERMVRLQARDRTGGDKDTKGARPYIECLRCGKLARLEVGPRGPGLPLCEGN